jgi:hypothetical protein
MRISACLQTSDKKAADARKETYYGRWWRWRPPGRLYRSEMAETLSASAEMSKEGEHCCLYTLTAVMEEVVSSARCGRLYGGKSDKVGPLGRVT